MDYFFYILNNVMLPIFLLILAGAVLNIVLKFDIKTLSGLLFNLLIPVMLFLKVYDSDLDGSIVLNVIIAVSLTIFIMYIISFLVSKVFRFSRSETSVFINSSTFFNSGNFSLPLMQLLFNNPFVISVQAIIMLANSILFFTTGVLTAGAGERGIKATLTYIIKMPLMYAITLAFILKNLDIKIYPPIMESMNLIATGYSALAIITLGAQLTQIKVKFLNFKIYLSNFLRLIISPAVAYFLVQLLGITGITAQVIVIAMGAPTAINVVLTSIQMDNEPDFASQAVFSSTLLASITMSLVIFMVFKYMPV